MNQEANAFALKLPTFWPEEPEVWFSQAESQFALRGITQDATKYHYVVAALEQSTAKRIVDLLQNPPTENKYDAIRQQWSLHSVSTNTNVLHASCTCPALVTTSLQC